MTGVSKYTDVKITKKKQSRSKKGNALHSWENNHVIHIAMQEKSQGISGKTFK